MGLFDDLKTKIEKNVKGAHVATMAKSEIATSRKMISTPCFDLNRILSGSLKGGLQTRNLVGIVGPEHSFKSSFMALCIASAQEEGFNAVILDTEGGMDSKFCERWGVDINNVLYIYTPYVDEIKSTLAQIRESNEENYIIVMDSVGGIDKIKSFEDALDGKPKADQGALQKEIKSMLKLYLNICIRQNSLGICAAHYYGKPSTSLYPSPDQIGGGKAVKLLPSILIALRKENIEEGTKEDKRIIGGRIHATTIKNRHYPPFQKAEIEIDYAKGVNKLAGILKLGVKAGIIEKNGAWYNYKDERLGQGAESAKNNIEKYPELLDEIDKWLETTGYSNINNELKEANEILEQEQEIKEPKKIKGKKNEEK